MRQLTRIGKHPKRHGELCTSNKEKKKVVICINNLLSHSYLLGLRMYSTMTIASTATTATPPTMRSV